MRFFASIHLLLLAYTVAIIVFWEVSLQRQSGLIYAQQVITLKSQVDSAGNPSRFNESPECAEAHPVYAHDSVHRRRVYFSHRNTYRYVCGLHIHTQAHYAVAAAKQFHAVCNTRVEKPYCRDEAEPANAGKAHPPG